MSAMLKKATVAVVENRRKEDSLERFPDVG